MLQGLNKAFGTELRPTQAVVDAVAGQFVFRPFGPVLVVVVGATMPLAVYEMREDTDGLDRWMQGYNAWLASDWAQAEKAFSGYAQQPPHDRAAPLFLATVRTFRSDAPHLTGTAYCALPANKYTPRLQCCASCATPLAGGDASGPAKPIPRHPWREGVLAARWCRHSKESNLMPRRWILWF